MPIIVVYLEIYLECEKNAKGNDYGEKMQLFGYLTDLKMTS